MCLAVVALGVHPRYAVVIAANRDEFHARPAAPAQWWDEGWLGGRDLAGGGTWLGVTRAGRWALLTNVRDPAGFDPRAPSRGALVTRAWPSRAAAAAVVATIVAASRRHNGFNLVGGDAADAHWGSNRGDGARALAPGIHGLSNHLLDTPWPKVVRTKAAVAALVRATAAASATSSRCSTFCATGPRPPTPTCRQPALPLARERLLSAPFIVSDAYGTRCSTLLTIGRDGAARFIERSFDPDGRATGDVDIRFAVGALR